MKFRFLLFLTTLFFSVSGNVFAQAPDECTILLSYFIEPARVKNYEAALPHYEKLIKECPKANLAAYQYAVRMFEYFIDEKGDKTKVNDLIHAWELRLENFPENTTEGEVLMTIAQLKFDNNIGTKNEQFKAFDNAFKKDPENFTSGKSLYTYFSLAVDLFNENKMKLSEIFKLYDEVTSKIETEKNNLAEKLTILMDKEANGAGLNDREQRNKN